VVGVGYRPEAVLRAAQRHAAKLPCNTRVSGRRRQATRPELARMYRVPPDRARWPAVGAPLEVSLTAAAHWRGATSSD